MEERVVGMEERVVGMEERVVGMEEGTVGQPYYFSGHLHPGIRIRGGGRQVLQFPCFYFGAEYAVLPAFGRFTGTVSIDPLPESNVFAILPPEGGERRSAGHTRSCILQIQ